LGAELRVTFINCSTALKELLQIGREQLHPYKSIELRTIEVVDVQSQEEHFEVTLRDGGHEVARKLVLATGVRDELPPIEGFTQFWGSGVFHCPYCYRWEMRDQPLTIYGKGVQARELALSLPQARSSPAAGSFCVPNGISTVPSPKCLVVH
jgi:thioredoxin reductase